MTYAIAKHTADTLTHAHDVATADLKAIVGDARGPMGMTPEHIKASDAWRAAYRTERAAFEAMRNANAYLVKNHGKQYRAECATDRAARRAQK